jgi:hypothetical protein
MTNEIQVPEAQSTDSQVVAKTTAPQIATQTVTPAIGTQLHTLEVQQEHDRLDHILRDLVNDHPFTVSGGAIIIGITILKIIQKLRRK